MVENKQTVKELEELLAQAKKAEQDKKDQQVKNGCDDLPDGTIIATSDDKGMVWCCSASSDQVIKHVISTLEAAEKTLKGSPMELMMSLAVAQHMAQSLGK